MGLEIDYYRVLGVGPQAGFAAIRTAYRRQARRCHPDMGGSQEQMIALIAAWEVLSDPGRRAIYDRARSCASDPAARGAWASVDQHAQQSASVTANKHGQTWTEFSKWVDVMATDVQRRRAGRSAAGAVGGAILGGALGAIAGPLMGIGPIAGLMIGLIAGALGGLIAAARSPSKASGAV